jgi:hypothetical protein
VARKIDMPSPQMESTRRSAVDADQRMMRGMLQDGQGGASVCVDKEIVGDEQGVEC